MYQTRDSPANELRAVAKCFCILEVVPPFAEIKLLLLLQMTALVSFRVKYNHTLDRFCLDDMFAA